MVERRPRVDDLTAAQIWLLNDAGARYRARVRRPRLYAIRKHIDQRHAGHARMRSRRSRGVPLSEYQMSAQRLQRNPPGYKARLEAYDHPPVVELPYERPSDVCWDL